MTKREIEFILKIETIETMPTINETIEDVCMNMQSVIKKIIIRRKIDAIIKKVKLNKITNM